VAANLGSREGGKGGKGKLRIRLEEKWGGGRVATISLRGSLVVDEGRMGGAKVIEERRGKGPRGPDHLRDLGIVMGCFILLQRERKKERRGDGETEGRNAEREESAC